MDDIPNTKMFQVGFTLTNATLGNRVVSSAPFLKSRDSSDPDHSWLSSHILRPQLDLDDLGHLQALGSGCGPGGSGSGTDGWQQRGFSADTCSKTAYNCLQKRKSFS